MLTAKQEAFCLEYIIDKNATQAYKRAGYKSRTDAIAAVEGHKLLRIPKIAARIDLLLAELAERNKVKADDVIQELKALAFWDINDFVSKGNKIKDISKMDRKTNKPIIGIKTKEEEKTFGKVTIKSKTVEIKLSEKRGALVDLGKHLGIFKEDNEQKVIKIKVTRK